MLGLLPEQQIYPCEQTQLSVRYFFYRNFVFPIHQDITMDHLVPLSRGGLSTKDNLVPSCKSCNNKKKSMLSLEWEEYTEKIRDRDV